MLQISERQESDKRKDSTSIHHFAAKLLKIIDFPIIFNNYVENKNLQQKMVNRKLSFIW